eukprot:TRINITY_DN8095_c0_g1_i10.p1 TRINITY_DN8095_c0_g1~~TRINITY_DN8095_c0_g1_i10.p1  ORF type:complete len:223 (+),score=55.70 TRINITY_DN8095_c0_g1_i10:850-1518(+)
MISGLIIAFLGFRIFNVVLFLMAAFIVGFIVFNLVYQLAASSITMEKAWVVWIILGAAALIGLIVGVFAVKYQRYCFLLAGACLGGIIGFLVFTAFLSGSLKIWAMYLIIAGAALIGAALGFVFKNPILIAGSSLMGSYLFVAGIGFFIKDIPSIMDIYNMIVNGNYKLTLAMYLYLGGVLLLTIVAIVVQCKFKPGPKTEEKENYDDEANKILAQYRSLDK